MRTIFKSVMLMALWGVFLQSCSSDDENLNINGPEILSFEYGAGASHSSEPVAYKGSDIHMEAEIHAEAAVASIIVEIHAHGLALGEGEEEWVFEQTYTNTKYQVINPTFHEHIDVPDNIPSGEYHIELKVVDTHGNTAEVEGHIHILSPSEAITVSDIEIDHEVVRGDDFHMEFMIHAEHGIHNIVVNIHSHGLNVGTGEAEWDYEAIFEEGFHGLIEAEFHKHIDVPATAPAGEYHIKITIEDEEGNFFEYETHIDIQES